MTSFAELEVIKMEYIGCVADILGPDPCTPEDSITMDELPELKIGEERNEVDGQSFANVAREESARLMESKDFKQINGWEKKLQQLTPPLSPTTSPQSKIPMCNNSAFPTGKDSIDAPGTLMDTEQEKVISQEEFEREILSLFTQEEEEANLGSKNTISTAASSDNAISAAYFPPLERTRQATKNLDAILKESKEMSSFSSLRKRRKSEKVPTQVPYPPKVNVDAEFGVSVVVYEDEYQELYGKWIKISICNFI